MANSGHENSTDIKFTFKPGKRYLVRDNDCSYKISEVKCLDIAEFYIKLKYMTGSEKGFEFWTDNKSFFNTINLIKFVILCELEDDTL